MQKHNPNNDISINPIDPFKDTITSLHFRPIVGFPMFLSTTSFSGDIRCFQIDNNGTSSQKACQQFNAPVLCSTWTSVCFLYF